MFNYTLVQCIIWGGIYIRHVNGACCFSDQFYGQVCISVLLFAGIFFLPFEMIDWFINPLEFFFSIEGHAALDKNLWLRYNNIPYSCDWSQEIFIVHVPIDSSICYLAFFMVGLYCQTPTRIPACQVMGLSVPFLWWSLVCPGWGMNLLSTAWEADKLTT